MLTFIDRGVHHGEVAISAVHENHMRQWTEAVRRLHTPHYEEGRQYIYRAMRDGRVDSHEIRPYTQNSLLTYMADYAE
ncbi:hypothetical protein [Deinococcus sp. UR1]|uniref:hypothetical protein n=1 Tax=Deinococcus sp. UR1 TaxID=1704277 RepID=UPI0006DCCEBC|nr:hypothetical protein [Deinococcus sp. UR1]PIG95849.1 hypothetical protein AMD26_019420 [Deinococcus sp. UR1]